MADKGDGLHVTKASSKAKTPVIDDMVYLLGLNKTGVWVGRKQTLHPTFAHRIHITYDLVKLPQTIMDSAMGSDTQQEYIKCIACSRMG